MESKEFSQKMGANLKRLRQVRGMSVEHVAEVMGISQDSVLKYERGDRRLSPDMIMRAAVLLNCSLLDIFSGLDPRVDDNGKELNVLSRESSMIMRHLATEWDGDVEALITFLGLVAMFPPEERREIYMIAAITKDRLLHAGTINAADLPPKLPYMEEQLGRLFEEG